MSKNSKAYRAAAEKVDRDNLYTPLQAAKLAKETSSTKQDATVEVAIRLGVDPRKADQMVRGTVNLPHGTGKTARVAVFAVGEKAEEATAAGADVVGSDDLIEKIQGGFLDFDAAIATPDQMAKVGRIARILGPRGLMPNPKTGTVTPDITKAVSEIKGGKGLDVTPYDPQPGTETTSPIDSTPVGEYTNGVGKKQAALHDKINAKAAENATVEV